jgi:hypothetical protein
MSVTTWSGVTDLAPVAEKALRLAARLWFLAAVTGQWIFVAYLIAFYGGSAARGEREAWNEILPRGYVPGDTMNNVAVAVHLILAVVIMLGGPLQLIPRIRQLAPRFHHWNGRVYLPSVVITSIAGLYMVWFAGNEVRLMPHIGVSLDALLIIVFAALTLRHAVARRLDSHRRWALRLFMVVNAGWFFRVGLMQWVFVNRGAVGFDPKTFTGPFITFLSFADYLLPLFILELYLFTKARGTSAGRFAMAGTLVVLTIAMAIGIFAASMVLWLPRM